MAKGDKLVSPEQRAMEDPAGLIKERVEEYLEPLIKDALKNKPDGLQKLKKIGSELRAEIIKDVLLHYRYIVEEVVEMRKGKKLNPSFYEESLRRAAIKEVMDKVLARY